MLPSLRQATRLLGAATSGLPCPAGLARMCSTLQVDALADLWRQPPSLSALFGSQQAVALPDVPTLLGRHALAPPAAQALFRLQQQQPAPVVLPELDDALEEMIDGECAAVGGKLGGAAALLPSAC